MDKMEMVDKDSKLIYQQHNYTNHLYKNNKDEP